MDSKGSIRGGYSNTDESAVADLAEGTTTRDEATNRRGRQALARLIRAHGGKVQDGSKSARPAATHNIQGASRASTVHALGGEDGTDGGKE